MTVERLPPPPVGQRFLAGVAGVLLGVSIALVGTVLAEVGPVVAGVTLSVGGLVTVVLVPVGVRWGAIATASRTGASLVLVAWLLTVLRLGKPTAQGSVLLAGDVPGLTVLLGGSLVGGLLVGVVRTDPVPGRFARARAARKQGDPSSPTDGPSTPQA